MTTYLKLETNALDITTALVILIVQQVIGILWLLKSCLFAVLSAAWENRQPLGKLVLIVAVAYILATTPALTIGIILIAAYAKATKP